MYQTQENLRRTIINIWTQYLFVSVSIENAKKSLTFYLTIKQVADMLNNKLPIYYI